MGSAARPRAARAGPGSGGAACGGGAAGWFVAASPPADTAGVLRAAAEIGLKAKMFGGPMVGLQYAAMKSQLGEQLNGIVCYELYVREPTMHFPGIDTFLTKYQARAASAGVDALGYYTPPFTYAALDILRQAVQETGGLDPHKLPPPLHQPTFHTPLPHTPIT